MVGWDFSPLDGRLSADEPWWDFEQDCRSAMARARRIADLGTGGGERLLGLLCPDDITGHSIIATEVWEPNIVVAQQALAPMGITVVRYDSEGDTRMPFADGSLDLVMSRQESIDPEEIARVLAPGGRLLTQQVDGHDAEEIHEWFGEPFAYLALTPWDAPNFSVSEHEAQLVALDQDRPIKVTQRRFRVYATKL